MIALIITDIFLFLFFTSACRINAADTKKMKGRTKIRRERERKKKYENNLQRMFKIVRILFH